MCRGNAISIQFEHVSSLVCCRQDRFSWRVSRQLSSGMLSHCPDDGGSNHLRNVRLHGTTSQKTASRLQTKLCRVSSVCLLRGVMCVAAIHGAHLAAAEVGGPAARVQELRPRGATDCARGNSQVSRGSTPIVAITLLIACVY
jgi:hypothetical protein